MPGPPPKPGAIRRRDGNPAKRPITDEPRIGSTPAVPDQFPAPDHLPADAAEVWREVVPPLVEIGLVQDIDATVLEAMCRFVARAREAEAYLDELGEHRIGAARFARCGRHDNLDTLLEETQDCEACEHERNAPPMPSFMHQGHRGATVHPAARVARDSWASAVKIASEYGLTPVGRLRIGAAVIQQKGLADELREALGAESDATVEGALAEVLNGET